MPVISITAFPSIPTDNSMIMIIVTMFVAHTVKILPTHTFSWSPLTSVPFFPPKHFQGHHCIDISTILTIIWQRFVEHAVLIRALIPPPWWAPPTLPNIRDFAPKLIVFFIALDIITIIIMVDVEFQQNCIKSTLLVGKWYIWFKRLK